MIENSIVNLVLRLITELYRLGAPEEMVAEGFEIF